MSQVTVEQALEIALRHHRAGRLPEAEQVYRQILANHPDHPGALHFLGVLASQLNRHDVAAELIRRSIALRPNDAEAHCNLGNILKDKGELDASIAACRRAIAINPNYPEAYNNLGNVLCGKGELDAAVAACNQAIALRPNYPEAYNNLANALSDKNEFDASIAAYRQAIALRPGYPEAYSNLGNALTKINEFDAAVAAYHQAIALRPDYAEAHSNLANALTEKKEMDAAVAACRKAIALRPDYAEAYCNLGNALSEKGELDAAIATYHQAIAFKPKYQDALNNLGNALCKRVGPDAAIDAYRQAIAINPDYPEAHSNLGKALCEKGEFDAAVAACRRAIVLRPNYPEAYCNLASALHDKGQLEEADAACRQAIALRPGLAEAHNNLANVMKDAGRLDEAIAGYRRAVELKPQWVGAHSNLVYTLHFHPGYDVHSILREHLKWNQQHAEPLNTFIRPHPNHRDPDRRLKIGYVSPDFRRHPVGRFILPLLEHHDHRQVEVFCYASRHKMDDVTERLRRHADVWRAVGGLSDSQLAEQVRADRIDVLVDLTLHMANGRLLVFARKPAPVQVSWLGYPGTTGVTAIDYRLTDAYMDPPGANDAHYSEESIRLPDIAACYRPTDPTPPVNSLPALGAGHVTFGCLNNFCKVTDAALATWIKILQAVPDSRLILHAQDGAPRQRAHDRLAREGMDPGRVSFIAFGSAVYFAALSQIDIALDPYPYGGGTTTCESLWMGIPVITRPGSAGVSRIGLATLSCIGLPEFAADSEETYIRTAIDWAGNLPRLGDLRATLREKMLASPLMDAPRFARNMEAAFRTMWRKWCAAGT